MWRPVALALPLLALLQLCTTPACSFALPSSPPSRVLCQGEVLYDCIANPSAAGWDLDRVVKEKAWSKWPGGAPANVASALSKLGTPAAFAGGVGDDGDATALLDTLRECGVDTSLARVVKGGATRRCMVTRDESGDRTFAGFADGLPSGSFADCKYSLEDEAPLNGELNACAHGRCAARRGACMFV
jgi:pfkB family carbohydrate kinase